MSDTFGPAYAAAYDLLYAEKDYGVEVELIEESFRRHSAIPVQSVLDLGCGTGSHARLLAGHGFQVTAVDRSAEMLEIARRKIAGSPLDIRWVEADLSRMRLGESFDAATLMFAVLGYFLTDDAVIEALSNIRRHVRAGGVLCFDFWYAPAVLAIGPSDRVRTFQTPEGELTRRLSATLDEAARICSVRYELEGGAHAGVETHMVRFFFADEMQRLLREAGFELISLSAFPSAELPVDATTWNAFCVARAV